MLGKALARVIVPVTPVRLMVSGSVSLPATHSPAAAPEAAFEFAEVIASRRVHKPSLPSATSAVLFTMMVLPASAAVAVTVDHCVESETTNASTEVRYSTTWLRELGDRRMQFSWAQTCNEPRFSYFIRSML